MVPANGLENHITNPIIIKAQWSLSTMGRGFLLLVLPILELWFYPHGSAIVATIVCGDNSRTNLIIYMQFQPVYDSSRVFLTPRAMRFVPLSSPLLFGETIAKRTSSYTVVLHVGLELEKGFPSPINSANTRLQLCLCIRSFSVKILLLIVLQFF